MSERRIERLINPTYSDLPAFLTKDGGLNSGFMIAQCTAAALVSEVNMILICWFNLWWNDRRNSEKSDRVIDHNLPRHFYYLSILLPIEQSSDSSLVSWFAFHVGWYWRSRLNGGICCKEGTAGSVIRYFLLMHWRRNGTAKTLGVFFHHSFLLQNGSWATVGLEIKRIMWPTGVVGP